MRQVARHKVSVVTVLPGTTTWIARGEREQTLAAGSLGEAEARTLTYGATRAFGHAVITMLGLDATSAVMTDGVSVTRLTLADGARAFAPVTRWELPGELGWNAGLAASPSGDLIVAASDRRLAAYGAAERTIQATGGFGENFRCPAVLPGGDAILVGRGDGRVERRDARTLDVQRTFIAGTEAVLALCLLDAHTAAVAFDDARTGLIDLDTGETSELALDRMKTSGLHRLADGRLLVVGLSRRVTIFDRTRLVSQGDLSETIGDRYVQGSALAGDMLLVACEAKGLWSVPIDALPQFTPAALPASPEQIRSAVTGVAGLALLEDALAAKQDVTAPIATLLAQDDEGLRRGVFMALLSSGTRLPDATTHLASPLVRVRFYAADHYGQLPALFADRAADLEPVLRDPDPSVVGAAAWAAGRVGDARAIPWLEPLLRGHEQGVRASAATALLILRGGADPIVTAIRDGGGELTFSALATLWPELAPTLHTPATPELLARLAAGLTLEAVLGGVGIAASPEFLAAHGAEEAKLTLRAGSAVIHVVYALALSKRWASTFDGTTLTLTTHAAAADFWATALPRELARERAS